MILTRICTCLSMLCKSVKLTINSVYATWTLSKLPKPRVTIFGGKRISLHCNAAKQAYELSKRLVKENISVITGGGPGVMSASCCGVLAGLNEMKKKEFRTLGITVKKLDEKFEKKCFQKLIKLDFFCTRKWFLINYSNAFVIFEGGVGTIDELFEVANLIKTKTIKPVPIILIDKEFWKPIDVWYKDVVRSHLIREEYGDLFTFTDSLDEAMEIIKKACKNG